MVENGVDDGRKQKVETVRIGGEKRRQKRVKMGEK
jgi:hypothetical protein